MKSTSKPQFFLLTAAVCLAVCTAFVPAASAGVVTTVFTLQKGNALQDGATTTYATGASYSGVVDGRITDDTASSALGLAATNVLGNQFRSGSANGQQHLSLFSYDLTDLNNFITANTSSSSSVTIQSVSFQLLSAGGVSGSSMSLGLYQTDPFTSSATWSTTDGSTAWSSPYQTGSVQYAYTGGASALTASLGAATPNTTITSGNLLTWTTSSTFVTAVQNALARADKKLYLTARGTFLSNSDNRLNVNFSSVGTAAYRPLLTITLQVTTTATWTGASSTSWATAGNWTPSGVPATDTQIFFNSSSTANLSTVLNQNFAIANLTMTTPTGPVSIGGANSLTINTISGIDMSGANQDLTITAPVGLGTNQTWTVAANRTLTVNGGVSGAFALTKASAGTLVLGGNGANTNLTVSGGTVSFATDGSTVGNPYPLGAYPASPTAVAVTLNGGGLLDTTSATIATNRGITMGASGGTLDASSSQTLNINSAITGSGALIKGTNSGTVTLNAFNTFTGGTTINGGTLAISSSGILYSAAANNYVVTVNNGATLQVYAWAYAPAGSIGNDFFGAGNLVINGGKITYTGVGEGSGSANNARLFTIGTGGATLNAAGTGTWYLETNPTYDTNALGAFVGQVIPNGLTLTLTGAGNGQYDKVLSGNGALIKSGAGTWTLAGNNAYTGGTTINGGALVPAISTNAIGTGTLTVNSGGVFYPVTTMAFTNAVTLNGGTLEVGGGNGNVLRFWGPVTVTTNSAMAADGGTFGLLLAGGVDLGSGGYTFNSFNNNSGNGNTISGQITGANGTIMNIAPNGTLWITGSNTFAGTFRATNGPISFQNVYALQNATLDMNAADSGAVSFTANVIIGALTGSRNLSLGALAVSIGNNNSSTTYSGALSGGGSLKKIGSGTLTLSGANNYTGLTAVSAGTLALSGSGSLASSIISVGGGAAFDLSAGSFTLGVGQVLSNSASATASLVGPLSSGSGTISVSFVNGTPAFNVTGGALNLSAATVIAVRNTGATLTPGTYKIISASGGGSVTGTAPTSVSIINGPTAGTPSVAIVGGELYLTVGGTANFSYGSTSLTYNGAAQGPVISYSSSTGIRTTNFVGTGLTTYASLNAPTNVGSYYVSNTVAADANYFGATNSQSFTINAAALGITANNTNKNYGQTISFAGTEFTTSGLLGDDSLSSITLASAGATNTATVGSYAIIASAAVGTGLGNYTITYTNGSLTVNQAATSVGASSTANPSGFKDSVAFLATLPADATGSVIFSSTNGPISTNSISSGSATSSSITNLLRGTNIITVAYEGDGNYLGSTNSLNQVVTNHPPVANNVGYTRNAAINTFKVTITNLLSNASDVDGDSPALVSIGATTNNAFAMVAGGYVLYYNTNAVADEFTYTVSDGFGETNTATVTINVDSAPLFGQSQIVSTSGGTATLNFAGIPGYSYSVSRSTNLVDWSAIWTTNAPASGVFEFIDGSAPMPSAYYRLQFNP